MYMTEATADASSCHSMLLEDDLPLAKAACEALVNATASANESYCPVLNIEGATRLNEEVWIGFRAPLTADGMALMVQVDLDMLESLERGPLWNGVIQLDLRPASGGRCLVHLFPGSAPDPALRHLRRRLRLQR